MGAREFLLDMSEVQIDRKYNRMDDFSKNTNA
jgi:hypothetical protein